MLHLEQGLEARAQHANVHVLTHTYDTTGPGPLPRPAPTPDDSMEPLHQWETLPRTHAFRLDLQGHLGILLCSPHPHGSSPSAAPLNVSQVSIFLLSPIASAVATALCETSGCLASVLPRLQPTFQDPWRWLLLPACWRVKFSQFTPSFPSRGPALCTAAAPPSSPSSTPPFPTDTGPSGQLATFPKLSEALPGRISHFCIYTPKAEVPLQCVPC